MYETLRLQEKLLLIDQIPIFTALSNKEKRQVASVATIGEHRQGAVIYRRGDAPDAFYCVITGRLKVSIDRAGREEVLEYLKRGKCFGIISVLTGEDHSATVRTVNDSVILRIEKDAFAALLKTIPELAITLGQILSRRLKRKDLHEKRVFESAIIAVFCRSDYTLAASYALNLCVSLKAQTGKRAILVDIYRPGEGLAGLAPAGRPIDLAAPFFDEAASREAITHHELGIDLIRIPVALEGIISGARIIQLLSFLTSDYHYIVVTIPPVKDAVTLDLLPQADMIHVITPSDETGLLAARELIDELEVLSGGIDRKIKVITSEPSRGEGFVFEKKVSILKHPVFATLPDINTPEYAPHREGLSLVTAVPESVYARAIRRVSRQIGDCFIGLALGCGAAIGFAHVGIMKVLEKERIPIDIVVGTSMGALIGALWASGKTIPEIEEIIGGYKQKIKTFGLVDLTFPRKGLIKGNQVRRFLKAHLGGLTFQDLKFPFKVVACDIESREEVVLDRGDLVDAVLASVSIPGVFEPVEREGRLLVDGGIVNPLPTNVLMRMGVPKIIAVNALPSPEDIRALKKRASNIFDIIVNSMQASEYLLAEMSCENADIALHPVPSGVDWYAFYEGAAIIRRGEEEALRYLAQLKELAAA